MARKLGKLMADFRNTTNEFKATWEREVNFEEEERALRTGTLPDVQVARAEDTAKPNEPAEAPEVRTVDAEEVRARMPIAEENLPDAEPPATKQINSDKRDWL